MPHDIPDESYEKMVQREQLTETDALLHEAFRDLAEQPLPDNLAEKVRRAILTANAAQPESVELEVAEAAAETGLNCAA